MSHYIRLKIEVNSDNISMSTLKKPRAGAGDDVVEAGYNKDHF